MLDQAGNDRVGGTSAAADDAEAASEHRPLGGDGIRRVRWVWLALAFITPWAGWIAWHQGRGDKGSQIAVFRIEGGSMAPTLVGEHRVASCEGCGLTWPFQGDSAEARAPTCFHCGEPAAREPARSAGDVVQLQLHDYVAEGLTGIQRGDLIAITWDGVRRIKRVAAMSNDTVDHQGMQLCLNGRRLDDHLAELQGLPFPVPWLPVDSDDRRRDSRWHALKGWTREGNRNWITSDSSWLIYQHHSIHEMNRASGVWDDNTYNVDVNRKLQSVDRLRLTLHIDSEVPVSLEVAFWLPEGNQLVRLQTTGSRDHIVTPSRSVRDDEAPVRRDRPVAFRILGGKAKASGLEVARLNQYRLRPQDDTSMYPITLGEGEVFVVGDNVPVSVDSRSVGKLKATQILGRVEPLDVSLTQDRATNATTSFDLSD
ncbi:MAG: S26 family signal peptidase [Rubripirellula sp.]